MALRQDDSAEFINAVVKDLNDHTEQKHQTKQGSQGSHTTTKNMRYKAWAKSDCKCNQWVQCSAQWPQEMWKLSMLQAHDSIQ